MPAATRFTELVGCRLPLQPAVLGAAGGIGTAERVAELIEAGADPVRVGTRFLATPECDAHADYQQALIDATEEDTVITSHFDGDGAWPAPVRVLAASLKKAAAAGN